MIGLAWEAAQTASTAVRATVVIARQTLLKGSGCAIITSRAAQGQAEDERNAGRGVPHKVRCRKDSAAPFLDLSITCGVVGMAWPLHPNP